MLNAKQALLAAAQIFEDYPERWTSGHMARDKYGEGVFSASPDAYCFCAIGILHRMYLEKIISLETKDEILKYKKIHNIFDFNDNKGREAVIKLLRRAAK